MESVDDFDTIDIELDELLTRKPTQRCQDSIPEEEEEEEDAETNSVEEENHEDNSEEEEGTETFFRDDEEDTDGEAEEAKEIEFTTHDPKIKWNKMIPCLGERKTSYKEKTISRSWEAPMGGLVLRPYGMVTMELRGVLRGHEEWPCTPPHTLC
ncbi:hypothetical protein LXL04_037309 [Taraxacum kok-saghyz]